MAGSLLGYFFYFGTAFAAVMTLLISVLGESPALSRVTDRPSHVIMRKAAVNEAHALKKQERLHSLNVFRNEGKKAPSTNPEQPLVVTAAKAIVEKNESERLAYRRTLKVITPQRDNVTDAYAAALSYADEPSPASGQHDPFTSLNSAH
jgi:hypothetical protein